MSIGRAVDQPPSHGWSNPSFYATFAVRTSRTCPPQSETLPPALAGCPPRTRSGGKSLVARIIASIARCSRCDRRSQNCRKLFLRGHVPLPEQHRDTVWHAEQQFQAAKSSYVTAAKNEKEYEVLPLLILSALLRRYYGPPAPSRNYREFV